MGAYQLWYISFKDKDSMKFFESLKLHKKRICAYIDWSLDYGDITYNMGYLGYAEGQDFLEKYYKKIKITAFKTLDCSCQTNWHNELKEFK